MCGELVYVGGNDETSLWSEYVRTGSWVLWGGDTHVCLCREWSMVVELKMCLCVCFCVYMKRQKVWGWR